VFQASCKGFIIK